MNAAQLSLTIELECDDALGILENVLATARRGGLQLAQLRLQQRRDSASVELAVSAAEAEQLDLFAARLNNVIGVISLDRATAPSRMYIAK